MLNTKAHSSRAWLCVRPQRSQDPARQASIISFICHRAAFSTLSSTTSSLHHPAVRITPSLPPAKVDFTKATSNLSPTSTTLQPTPLALNQVSQILGTAILYTPSPTPQNTCTNLHSLLFKHLIPVSSTREPANHNLRSALLAAVPRSAARKLNQKCEHPTFFFFPPSFKLGFSHTKRTCGYIKSN